MNTGFGSWLLGMSLGASALGGMLGMASSIFIVLAATTFGSALLYSISGFGFAVLAAPVFLLFLDPASAIQLIIIISTVLSIVVLRGLLPAIAPRLLLRLALGSLVGLPLGLIAFRYVDPILVRAAAGAMIFGFAILMAVSRRQSGQPDRGKHWTAFAMSPGLDLAAGAVSGFAGALVGQPGPPVLIYLLLAGAAARSVRATLLAFFALSYGVTLASHAATIGIPAPTWLAAGILIPFAFLGGLAGRPIGDRLGSRSLCNAGHCPAGGGWGLHPQRRGRCICHRLATTGRSSPRARPSSPPSRREERRRLPGVDIGLRHPAAYRSI